MNSAYEKLPPFQKEIGSRLTNMSGRTPSFIVVGLVIIMFLLGSFYMSCSSKNTELRVSLEQFEERIRSLTMKNSDADKKFENLNSHKRELEEEKLTIQRQMEKKDSEINDLNTKLNEKKAELDGLKSDKQVLDQQLKESKTLSETIASKNSLIERLQQQLNEQKQLGTNEQSRLQQEIDALKNRGSQNNGPASNEQRNVLPVANQRYQPLISENNTTRSIAELFRDPLDKFNNLTKEIKAQMVPAAIEVKNNVLSVLGVNGNTSNNNASSNQQQGAEIHNRQNPFVGQNAPAPPLADNRQQQQQVNHVESAQAAPQHNRLLNQDRGADNLQDPQRQQQQREFNNGLSENKKGQPVKDVNNNEDAEKDDEDQLEDEVQQKRPPVPLNALNLPRDDRVPARLSNEDNYRVADRERFRPRRGPLRQGRQSENGEEVGEGNNQRRHGPIRSRNIV